MRAPSLLLAAVVATSLAACSSPGPRPFGQPETQAINQLITEFIALYNAKDAAKLSRLFTEGGSVMPPNASSVKGTEGIREYYVRRFEAGASDLGLEAETIAGSGALAFATGDYRLNMRPAGGHGAPRPRQVHLHPALGQRAVAARSPDVQQRLRPGGRPARRLIPRRVRRQSERTL